MNIQTHHATENAGPDMNASRFAPGSAQDALRMQNGCAAPLAAIPLFSFAAFAHWLSARTREGNRVSAFFAVPVSVLEKGSFEGMGESCETGERWRIFAVLADESASSLLIAGAETGSSYPSLTPRIPQLHLFERELYEKHGLLPEGHPWLKPVRFSNPRGPLVGDMEFYRVHGDEVHEVAVGPIHAGVIECGHFRFQCQGEVVMHLEISLGYHHRGMEALLRGGPNARTLPLMEVLAGDSTIAHTWAYCGVREALAGAAPLPRGQLIRALGLELERLANHTGDLGAIAGDIGFLPTLSFCGRLRGDWLNMSAMLCGSRFGRGLVVPGGSAFEMDHALTLKLQDMLRRTERDVQGAIRLIWDSPSVLARLTGIGPISLETAAALGLVGPAARSCGLARDARHHHPLSGLPVPPDIAIVQGGDVRTRTLVRHKEITASAAFCRHLLKEFLYSEDGDETRSGFSANAVPLPESGPERIAVTLVEGWRGEVCHAAISGRDGRFLSYTVTDPSFHNWMGLAVALRGQQISDFPLCNKSFNLSYCGHDQ